MANGWAYRTFVRFCPHCLHDDAAFHPGTDDAARRFRWAWLLRPVVICPEHGVVLAELPAPDAVRAFDLPKLLVDHDFMLPEVPTSGEEKPGALQSYVMDRLVGRKNAAAWLDGQDVASGVKACEMLGALIDGGPEAQISGHTEVDWARVGDIGFQTCAQGPDAILGVLAEQRISSGRRSGRAGPQAAYGFLFNWLNYTRRSDGFGPLRQIVHDAIVENFAMDAGEVILGREVTQRRTHSVNSLVNATGINRFRLYRLMRKAGMIPETADKAAFNQWVFPAEKGERLIARIQNSVPLNQVQRILGCSKTQAEQVARQGLIKSVVPISEGQVGLTQGHFNRNDLASFMDDVMRAAVVWDAEEEGYVNLTAAARPRSSTVEILQWHMDDKLIGTRLLNGIQRLDHLRFELVAVRALVTARRGPDLNRLTSVAVILGIKIEAVKALIALPQGAPSLVQAPAELCSGLDGAAYVATAEIERFQAKYATIAMIARTVGLHARSVQRLLEGQNIQPVFDPVRLGARIYRRADIARFVAERGATDAGEKPGGKGAVSGQKSAVYAQNGAFGEFYDVIL
ncbi:MAG: TniQ family protein [Paracoccaceae bacterium]